MSASKVTLLGLAALAYAAPQGVPEDIKPEGNAPEGCMPSSDGPFEISVVKPAAKRDFMKRQDDAGTLVLTLENGILKDEKGRTGYIASNYQFQFDAPPQDGAIYTGGFSVCPDGNLALGSSETFYQCLSGGFYNLYNEDWAEQCNPVIVKVIPSGGSSNGSADQSPDGQPVAPTTTVSQIMDGQIQVPTSVPTPTQPVISQITDGQIQAPSAPAVSQIGDGQIQAPEAPVETPQAPVTQIGDGQIQAPVTQIGDGQIQAPEAPVETPQAPVTQIGDGQIQAPSAPVEEAPPPNNTVPVMPPSSGDRVFPATMIALFVATVGTFLAL